MPRTKTAERAAREAEIKRQRNRAIKSATKTFIDKAGETLAGGDVEKAKLAVKAAISQVDRAMKSGIIHRNTASRRKSNLMKKFNKAFGAQALTTAKKPKKAAKKPVKTKKAKAQRVKKEKTEEKA